MRAGCSVPGTLYLVAVWGRLLCTRYTVALEGRLRCRPYVAVCLRAGHCVYTVGRVGGKKRGEAVGNDFATRATAERHFLLASKRVHSSVRFFVTALRRTRHNADEQCLRRSETVSYGREILSWSLTANQCLRRS